MECPLCGASNPDENRYCGKCGNSLPSQESGVYWSKHYGFPGFGGSVVQESDDVYIETSYGFLGWRARERYPRWMAMLIIFPGLLVLLGLSLVLMFMGLTHTDLWEEWLLLGLLTLSLTALVAFIVYWLYRPPAGAPRGPYPGKQKFYKMQGDLPAKEKNEGGVGYNRRL